MSVGGGLYGALNGGSDASTPRASPPLARSLSHSHPLSVAVGVGVSVCPSLSRCLVRVSVSVSGRRPLQSCAA
eukprot:2359771-Rhodomonas_salina.1